MNQTTKITPEKAEATFVTLYQEDKRIIKAVASRNGQSDSAALRFIVRDWARRSDMTAPLQPDDEAA